MLTPLNSLQINPLLHQLPQRAQLPQKAHPLPHRLEHIINLPLRRKPPNPKPNTTMRALIATTQRPQDVAGLERGGGTGRPGGEGDVLEGHEERLAFDVGEGDVDAARVVTRGVAV